MTAIPIMTIITVSVTERYLTDAKIAESADSAIFYGQIVIYRSARYVRTFKKPSSERKVARQRRDERSLRA